MSCPLGPIEKVPVEALALMLILRTDYVQRYMMPVAGEVRVIAPRRRAAFAKMRSELLQMGFLVPRSHSAGVFFDVWCELARMHDIKVQIKESSECPP